MLFNSHIFIFFFLPVTFAGFLLSTRYFPSAAFGWLVLCSLFFYGWWNPPYLVLLCASIVLNYWLGSLLRNRHSKLVLYFGIALNLGAIAYYKYAGFFAETANTLLGTDYAVEKLLLPLGISFFTFQQITYLVESYRRTTVPHNLTEYALFVSFFPQLIAGPIVHESQILPQFRNPAIFKFSYTNLALGLTIFAIGLGKKVLIADRLGFYASPVFAAAASGEPLSAGRAWAGVLSYCMQLYFDFSGYSDMAIGLGLLFGIAIPLNFFSPYKATSIIEFWRRWHITLSHFLRDYLYFPLGGNRKGAVRRYGNLLVVMTIGGLWHGAGWTFVVWGLLHGVFLTVNHLWRSFSRRLPAPDSPGMALSRRALAWGLTFLCVNVGWVFFRSADMGSALSLLHSMAGLTEGAAPAAATAPGWTPRQAVLLGLALLIALGGANVAQVFTLPQLSLSHTSFHGADLGSPVKWRSTRAWALLAAGLLLASVMDLSRYSEFLYFNF